MDVEKIIKGKRILIADDEPDILETLMDLLDVCRIDTADSYDSAKMKLETVEYQAAVLDIMGVKGYELLKIAKSQGIPAIMLTANALSAEDLKLLLSKERSIMRPRIKWWILKNLSQMSLSQ